MSVEKETPTCTVEGCERSQDYPADSICVGHYRRLERLMFTWEANHESMTVDTRTRNRLMKKVLASGPLRKRKTETVECAQDNCERAAEKRTYCNVHYNLHLAWGDLPPTEYVEV